jgi:hypothetical protein
VLAVRVPAFASANVLRIWPKPRSGNFINSSRTYSLAPFISSAGLSMIAFETAREMFRELAKYFASWSLFASWKICGLESSQKTHQTEKPPFPARMKADFVIEFKPSTSTVPYDVHHRFGAATMFRPFC